MPVIKNQVVQTDDSASQPNLVTVGVIRVNVWGSIVIILYATDVVNVIHLVYFLVSNDTKISYAFLS